MITIIKDRYKTCWGNPHFLFSTVVGLVVFTASIFLNYYAGTYATEKASNAVTDIILSNTTALDVDGLFIYGSVALVVFIVWLCIVHPRRIPFVLYTLALFILTRSIFISLTHIGPFPDEAPLDLGSIISKFIFGGDLFFSGHTGIPFLMALIFWKELYLRYFFIGASLFFGTVALLGHYHYSIDVLAAFFITYTIYHLAEKFFVKEKELFERE